VPWKPGLLGILLLAAGVASAEHGPAGPIFITPGYAVAPGYGGTSCYEDVRLFETLRDGYFPYCREKLRYRPGRLECARVVDRICTVVDPVSLQVVESRTLVHKQIVTCPEGPEPPSCRKLDFH